MTTRRARRDGNGQEIVYRPPTEREAILKELTVAGRALSTAAVMFHSTLAAKQGLSATEEKALDLIERFGPLTAGDLAERAGLAPASVTGLVDRLTEKGFARRTKDPVDGRRVLVAFEPKALSKLAPLFEDFVREMDELYAGYSVDELRTILHFVTEAARRQRDATERLVTPRRKPARKR